LNLITSNNTVSVVASDLNSPPKQTTQNYSLTVAGGVGKTYSYDLNGNMTMNGSQTYEWDAEDRLTAINNGSLRSEFSYDGFGRRVKIVEKNNGTVMDTKKFIWDGERMVQSIEGPDNPVPGNLVKFVSYYDEGCYVDQKIMSSDGFNEVAGTAYYYTRDHLGSIREMLDNNGNIVARYDYDPYGRRTLVQGTDISDFGYAGYYVHQPSGLQMALYRAYDADSGRFINRDPIGELGGLNLYDYVENDPVNRVDPNGKLALGEVLVVTAALAAIGLAAWEWHEAGKKSDENAKKSQAAADAIGDPNLLNNLGKDPNLLNNTPTTCTLDAAPSAIRAGLNTPLTSGHPPIDLATPETQAPEDVQNALDAVKGTIDLTGTARDANESKDNTNNQPPQQP
jgi:RHS repeat-associated protein